jgi:tetratricopeptide (TPR) repeat protein
MTRPGGRFSGLALVLACFLVTSSATAQVDSRSAFQDALGQFGLALIGQFGDEGPVLESSLAALQRALGAWDAVIDTSETAMEAERKGATPELLVRLHVALGAVYLDRGRAGDALREFAAASAIDSARADIRTFQALAGRQLTKEPAIDELGLAAALEPRDLLRAYQLARGLLATGRTSAGVRELERFLDLPPFPFPPSPFLTVGLVPESPGVEPFFPPVRYAKAFAALSSGAYPDALREMTDALSTDPLAAPPGAGTIALRRAASALRDGDVTTAIAQLTGAIAIEPERSEAHRVLGHAYLLDQQFEKAVASIAAAVGLSPGDERARLALAAAQVQSGRLQAAAETLSDTLKVLPSSGQAHYELGLVHQREGRYPDALASFEAALRFAPLIGANSIYQTMGALRRSQQDFDGAAESFSRRIELIPNDAAAHHELGDVYLRQNRHTEALAELTVAVMLDPSLARAHAAAAQVHLREGRYGDAAEAATRVLGLDPEHREARYTLATSLIRLGRAEDGKKELAIFQRMQAEDAAARSRVFELEGLTREAAVSAASGDHGKAVALLQKVVDDDPTVAGSILDLGLALVAAGRHSEAIRFLKKAAELGAHHEVHKHLAAAYGVLGQMDESRRAHALYEQLKRDDLRRAGANR